MGRDKNRDGEGKRPKKEYKEERGRTNTNGNQINFIHR